MAPQATIFVAQYNGKDIGAAFCFAAFGILTAWFIVDDRQYRALRPSTLLCAALMQFGIERHLHTFDLGPSSPSDGSFTFKQRLGAVPLPQYQAIKPYPVIARIKQYCKYLLGRS
jgi:CelD/BcsL family acetyltransferase involved in cellulose biosynthesis